MIRLMMKRYPLIHHFSKEDGGASTEPGDPATSFARWDVYRTGQLVHYPLPLSVLRSNADPLYSGDF